MSADIETRVGNCSTEIDGMSVKELRNYLQARGISTTGMLEKREYVEAAKATL